MTIKARKSNGVVGVYWHNIRTDEKWFRFLPENIQSNVPYALVIVCGLSDPDVGLRPSFEGYTISVTFSEEETDILNDKISNIPDDWTDDIAGLWNFLDEAEKKIEAGQKFEFSN